MNIEIRKQDFELAVKAARDPKGRIFDVLETAIHAKADMIGQQILGEPGVNVVENGTDSQADMLRMQVIQLACVSTFLEEMRGLDLVLTATGFGVVSTNDTAPASKMRVDALDGELRRKERQLRGDLITRLFRVNGWSETPQRYANVQTLFFSIQQLETWAGISRAKPEDWDSSVPTILAADAYLRKHLGNAYMDELLAQVTSYSLTNENGGIALLCQQYIGACIAQNMRLKEETYMRMINRMEADLSQYPTYANGEGYRLNHFKPYENHAEDSAFHFIG